MSDDTAYYRVTDLGLLILHRAIELMEAGEEPEKALDQAAKEVQYSQDNNLS